VDEARKSQKELLLFKVDFEKTYDPLMGLLGFSYGTHGFSSFVKKVD